MTSDACTRATARAFAEFCRDFAAGEVTHVGPVRGVDADGLDYTFDPDRHPNFLAALLAVPALVWIGGVMNSDQTGARVLVEARRDEAGGLRWCRISVDPDDIAIGLMELEFEDDV